MLLCSDGLSDAIPSQEILRIVEEHAGDGEATVGALVGAAIQVAKTTFRSAGGRRAVCGS